MGKEDYSHSYELDELKLLDEANVDILGKILAKRIRFVHEEYINTGRCTPWLLDQLLLMDTLAALEVDINLNPEKVTIKDLPQVKATRRAGKISAREHDIADRVASVGEQLRPVIGHEGTMVTLRLSQPHRDGQTNADVYPRITGILGAVLYNGQELDYTTIVRPLSIPLSMIIQAGPNAVRCISGKR